MAEIDIPETRITTIEGSPWKNRKTFSDQLRQAVPDELAEKPEGMLFQWKGRTIFGEDISLSLENMPDDESTGAHALLIMENGEDSEGLELNTNSNSIYREGNVKVLDIGDDQDIVYFIEMCARALEAGMSVDGIREAAYEAQRNHGQTHHNLPPREGFPSAVREEFSKRLSERYFL